MKQLITPTLWYNAGAKEAAELYCSVFADAKIKSQNRIVTTVDVGGQTLTLIDGGPIYKPNPSVSFYYIAETEEELDRIWNAFSKEGKVMMGLDKYPWAEKYGWVSDKFDISWQLALGKISDVGQRITPCLMFVGKEYGRVDEALELYSKIFKDTKIEGVLRYPAGMEPDKEGMVQHSQLQIGNQKLMLMESAHEHKFEFTHGISLMIHPETDEEREHYWNELTKGGKPSKQGWLQDKFGVSWQVLGIKS